jgi:plasmid stability protein
VSNIAVIGRNGYNGRMEHPTETPPMASLNIRQLDPALKEKLRIRAARNGRSMEAEARVILKESLSGAEKPLTTGAELVDWIRQRFGPLGGVELELPPRGPAREPPDFSGH